MSITINLGVVDTDYSIIGDPDTTTGKVAKILEKEYGVMAGFVNKVEDDVTKKVLAYFSKGEWDDFAKAEVKDYLEEQFFDYIFFEQAKRYSDYSYKIPTMAAQFGWSSIKKEWTGVPRPSFMDTETYLKSFTVWYE